MSATRVRRNYDDYTVCEPYMDAFMARLAALTEAGQYRYNDSFRGHIGYTGGDQGEEDFLIYMCQGLEHQRAQDAKVAALVAQGYQHVTTISKDTRYAHIVLYPTRRMGGEWAEYRDARLIPSPYGRNNCADVGDTYPYAVLPKGRRTHGHLIMDRAVLVSP